jgi:hypothetical protein
VLSGSSYRAKTPCFLDPISLKTTKSLKSGRSLFPRNPSLTFQPRRTILSILSTPKGRPREPAEDRVNHE